MGSCEYLKTVTEQEASPVRIEKLEMSECEGSVSPKLDKACSDCDSEELSEEQTSRFRSSVLKRLLCTKLKSPTALEMDS